MAWLRRSFLAGFFVTVPLVISVAALVWIFGIIDGFTAPLTERVLGREVPCLVVQASRAEPRQRMRFITLTSGSSAMSSACLL
jgi:uncharacterized membrane protein